MLMTVTAHAYKEDECLEQAMKLLIVGPKYNKNASVGAKSHMEGRTGAQFKTCEVHRF
jgi:hypothetical protein